MSFRKYPFYRFNHDFKNHSSGGGCLTVIILFIVSVYLFSIFLMNIGLESVTSIFLGFILTFLLTKLISTGIRPQPERQNCVFGSFGDGGFSCDYFYTDQVNDRRGASVKHKNYVATKIFPDEFNFVVAICVNSESKEYFFTKSSVSKMSIQFSDKLPGSILLVLHPCFFELGSESLPIRQAEADSARKFVDFIKKCARN